mmetsp:Transcript_16115/g.14568  ORF Transcript_16115/g.14568 Transcript_16115/m.14568 type:complete len:178 (+) Transcript_16115:128-661(+)
MICGECPDCTTTKGYQASSKTFIEYLKKKHNGYLNVLKTNVAFAMKEDSTRVFNLVNNGKIVNPNDIIETHEAMIETMERRQSTSNGKIKMDMYDIIQMEARRQSSIDRFPAPNSSLFSNNLAEEDNGLDTSIDSNISNSINDNENDEAELAKLFATFANLTMQISHVYAKRAHKMK